jgi:hypothetical protein
MCISLHMQLPDTNKRKEDSVAGQGAELAAYFGDVEAANISE